MRFPTVSTIMTTHQEDFITYSSFCGNMCCSMDWLIAQGLRDFMAFNPLWLSFYSWWEGKRMSYMFALFAIYLWLVEKIWWGNFHILLFPCNVLFAVYWNLNHAFLTWNLCNVPGLLYSLYAHSLVKFNIFLHAEIKL